MKYLLLAFAFWGSSHLALAQAPAHVERLHQAIEHRQAVVSEAATAEDPVVKKAMEAQARYNFWEAVNEIYQPEREPIIILEPEIIDSAELVPVPAPKNSFEKAFGVFFGLFR